MATYTITTVQYHREDKDDYTQADAFKFACQKAKKLPRGGYVSVHLTYLPKATEYRIARSGDNSYLIVNIKTGKVGHVSPNTGEVKW